MKVLVTTGDFSCYLSPGFHYLMNELGKLVDLTLWHNSGDIHDIIRQSGANPDFVLINEFTETNSPAITGLKSLSIPWAVSLHDLHYEVESRQGMMNEENVRWVFSYYRDKFSELYPEFWPRYRWLPHHVNTDIFYDYGLPRDIDFLMMGAVHERVYPLRCRILERMQDTLGFVYHEHPGYRNFADDEGALVGAGYARELNRAKMFLTCDSIHRYPLSKYFEVLGCKTLLLAPSSQELSDLGFIAGVHFVEIDEYNFEEKAHYYLHHEGERLQIAEQGYEMVRLHHPTTRRAHDLVIAMEEIRSTWKPLRGWKTSRGGAVRLGGSIPGSPQIRVRKGLHIVL